MMAQTMFGSMSIAERNRLMSKASRKMFLGYNPLQNVGAYTPPVSTNLPYVHEGGTAVTTQNTVGAINSEALATIQGMGSGSTLATLGATYGSKAFVAPIVITIAIVLGMIARLTLTVYQKTIVQRLVMLNVPKYTAWLIAITAPWVIETMIQHVAPKVALYRLNQLIGRLDLDDWERFERTMRTAERNTWKARSA